MNMTYKQYCEAQLKLAESLKEIIKSNKDFADSKCRYSLREDKFDLFMYFVVESEKNENIIEFWKNEIKKFEIKKGL